MGLRGSSLSARRLSARTRLEQARGIARSLVRFARQHRAGVVGGLLALGSCGLAGCDEASEPVEPPAAETAPAPPPADPPPEPAPVPTEPDLEATEAALGALEVAPGFLPDPTSRVGTTRGGPIDANRWDDRCDGWIAADPDAIVRIVRPIAELAVMVASEDDTTVVVVGPDGQPRCSDDDEGTDPVLRGTFDAGEHRVWVGTRESGARARYVLSLSELDDTLPSQTLQ